MGTPCPEHTYSNDPRRDSAAACVACPEGFYCPPGSTFLGALGDPNDIETTPGNKPILCPAGWYCPGSTASKCPMGSYNPSRGAISLANCLICPEGFLCATEGTTTPTLCIEGHYCPPGSILPIACPSGTYSYFESNTDAPNFPADFPTMVAAASVVDCFAVHPGKWGASMTECKLN